jgi:tetratricopeptide (TPR) repeat protein
VKNKFAETFPNVDLTIYDRFIIIYGGDLVMANSVLWPNAVPTLAYITSERAYSRFSHVGTHAHEFGHLLGAMDEYNSVTQEPDHFYDVMNLGNYDGDSYNGSCPASHNPANKLRWQWVSATHLTNQEYQNLELTYNYAQPNYFVIDIPDDPTEYYILENRLRNKFDLFTPNDPSHTFVDTLDLNGAQGGLLIWTVNDNKGISNLKCAFDYSYHEETSYPFPYNNAKQGNSSGLCLTQASTPDNHLISGANTNVQLLNIRWADSTKKVILDIQNPLSSNYYYIDENVTFVGTSVFDKDLVVMPNGTMTLLPGATIKMNALKKIIVLDGGKIILSGNSSDTIDFKNNQTNQWGGIELIGMNANITGSACCRIVNADIGISFYAHRNLTFNRFIFQNYNRLFDLISGVSIPFSLTFNKCCFSNHLIAEYNTSRAMIDLKFNNCVFSCAPITSSGLFNLSMVNNDLFFGSDITLINGAVGTMIKNNIFFCSTIDSISSNENVKYNCIYPNTTSGVFANTGNFSANPLYNDNHYPLLYGNSPCIDAGDTSSAFSNEPLNNGGRINLGSLGNTSNATTTDTSVFANGHNLVLLGDFVSKRKWTFDTDFLVPENTTTAFLSGSELKFGTDNSLNVLGTLKLLGSPSKKLKVSCANISNGWGNFTFDGFGAASSIIDYADISYGAELQCLNGADITIRNSTISHQPNGIYIYFSEPKILNNSILGSDNDGIYGQGAGCVPNIHDNIITKTRTSNTSEGIGVYLIEFINPQLTHNDIQGFNIGMYFGGTAYPVFYGSPDCYTPMPNNRMIDNYTGLAIGWGSCCVGGSDDLFGGFNSIYDNTYTGVVYHNSYWSAFYNYWGPDQPNIIVDTTSLCESDRYLEDDPWNIQNKINTSTTNQVTAVYKTKKNPFSTLIGGRKIEYMGDITGAVNHYEEMVKSDDNTELALSELAKIYKKYNTPGILEFIQTQSKGNTKHFSRINTLLAELTTQSGGYDNATQLYNKVISSSSDSHDGYSALFDKFFAALYTTKDVSQAEQIYKSIATTDFNDEDLNHRFKLATHALENASRYGKQLKKQTNVQSNEVLPKEYNLANNYPNPFNPYSIIGYQIPEAGNVTLKVFDALGRVVRTLVNENKAAGKYNVRFDGSNLASGIYFYRLTCNHFTSTKKMILMK